MYALVIGPEFGLTRDELAKRLAAQGIETRTFFCPMGQQPFLRGQPGFRDIACPVADRIWQSGLYLPSANALDDTTMGRVAAAIKSASR